MGGVGHWLRMGVQTPVRGLWSFSKWTMREVWARVGAETWRKVK